MMLFRFIIICCCYLAASLTVTAQKNIAWVDVSNNYGLLPAGVQVFFTNEKLDTGAFRAFYVVAPLKNKSLHFTTDTTHNRRFTPTQFYQKSESPLVVVNGTFFSFATNQNLNLVVKNKKLVGYNVHTVAGRGKDTFTYRHPYASAIGISKKRKADVAWTLTDSTQRFAYAVQNVPLPLKDSAAQHSFSFYKKTTKRLVGHNGNPNTSFKKWKAQTAIGGGPVLVQNGAIRITNNEELKFGGNAVNDKHPRTAMGYTADGRLIILAVEGRNKAASGATLTQLAGLLQNLGCVEALNLDGGGSSCLLVNGRETIKPSDAGGQRPVPAVFMIQASKH
jgi:exopolysaccharide biosynthesis protein